MIDKKFSTKLLKAILRRSQKLSEHKLIHPEREWFIGLGIALAALIAGVTWSINLYITYANLLPGIAETSQNAEQIYREGEVKRALEELRARKEKNDIARQSLDKQPSTPFIILEPEIVTEEEPLIDESVSSTENTATSSEIEPGVAVPAEAL